MLNANKSAATAYNQIIHSGWYTTNASTGITANDYYYNNYTYGSGNMDILDRPEPIIQSVLYPTVEEQQRIAAEERFFEEELARQTAPIIAARAKVTARAESLLLSALTPDQTKDFRKTSEFTVISKDGKRTYRITYGIAGNVILIEKGKPVARYCIHPTGIPTEDVMLAQKLMLETDEESFLRIANRTPLAA